MRRLYPGDRVQARTLRLLSDGQAEAQDGDVSLSVAGALPGERVEARVQHVSCRGPKARVYADAVEVLEPHPQRRAPPCIHQGRCHGCPLMIASEPHQRELKRGLVEQILGAPVAELVAIEGGELGYRWSSKRVVAGRAGAVLLGSYRRRSHQVARMNDCLVDHPDIAAAAREIEDVANDLGIEPYDEGRKTGDLRYVWLKTNGRSEVLVTLISAAESSRAPELAERLALPSGVAWCVQVADGNAIRSPDVRHLRGARTLAVELCGHRLEQGPLSFLQPNPAVAELAYRELVGDARGALAFDLYAGAGITTALLKNAYDEVIPCEAYPEAARALGSEPQPVAELLYDARQARLRPDRIVANPPRAGLGEEVCALIRELAPPKLSLMSCSAAALARDLERLSSRFSLERITAYDTLPQTTHVELVAQLTRTQLTLT